MLKRCSNAWSCTLQGVQLPSFRLCGSVQLTHARTRGSALITSRCGGCTTHARRRTHGIDIICIYWILMLNQDLEKGATFTIRVGGRRAIFRQNLLCLPGPRSRNRYLNIKLASRNNMFSALPQRLYQPANIGSGSSTFRSPVGGKDVQFLKPPLIGTPSSSPIQFGNHPKMDPVLPKQPEDRLNRSWAAGLWDELGSSGVAPQYQTKETPLGTR